MAILSKQLSMLDDNQEKQHIVDLVIKKFEKLPNTGYLHIWLQRIALPAGFSLPVQEPLCRLVSGDSIEIWESNWIESPKLIKLLDIKRIVDHSVMSNLTTVIEEEEIRLFDTYNQLMS